MPNASLSDAPFRGFAPNVGLTGPSFHGYLRRMDGRSATIAALGVALLGIVASLVLDGVAAGLVLFVAGVLLVVIGIFGWHEPTPATAMVDVGSGSVEAPMEPSIREVGDPDAEIDGPDTGPEIEQEMERQEDGAGVSSPEEPVAVESVPDVEALTRTLTERLDQVRERVNEKVATPDLGSGAAEPEPVAEPGRRTEIEPDPEMSSEPSAELGSSGEDAPPDGSAGTVADHDHDQPLLNHSDLVSHVRDYHEGVRTDGSTIQLRLLHEREHGAPP